MIIDQWIVLDFTYPVEDAQFKILNCQLHILSPTSRYWGIPVPVMLETCIKHILKLFTSHKDFEIVCLQFICI
jgi:hypothetical protein